MGQVVNAGGQFCCASGRAKRNGLPVRSEMHPCFAIVGARAFEHSLPLRSADPLLLAQDLAGTVPSCTFRTCREKLLM